MCVVAEEGRGKYRVDVVASIVLEIRFTPVSFLVATDLIFFFF